MASNHPSPTPRSLLAMPHFDNSKPRDNKNGPDHKFQVNQHLLYERDFGGETFVSAHLQRLQNGCFTDKNIHSENMLHVTFAAITFTFHPALSEEHRFRSAVITIAANSSSGQPIRFLKFAPHLAFGKISSASLKWNFQLAATVGVTKGPARASLTPSVGYQKDLKVGTMMKIQGSTRSTIQQDHLISFFNSDSPPKPTKRFPDTRLVWSLEENSQQESGLPREFTFVFLMERVHSDKEEGIYSEISPDGKIQTAGTPALRGKIDTIATVQGSQTLPSIRTPKPRRSILPIILKKEPSQMVSASGKNNDEKQLAHYDGMSETLAETMDSMGEPSLRQGSLDGVMENISKVTHIRIRSKEEYAPVYFDEPDPQQKALDSDYTEVFTPVYFSISVQPRINGSLENKLFEYETQRSVVSGEVGQKFPTALFGDDPLEGEQRDALINGLYNFAKVPGTFEDLIELPGNSITTVEPTLS
ncbi:hypothetical protein G7Y89_g9834 [Cudoniella acicularis]|uniref:Uncharacterized protein n=1 Tax=Cudoniella acicularis TaxID=354080 RepID=A0A8H4VZR5_9HELO|nr:hypothetical protein G7Y89_g9834 [Cudoniella acicularis]